LGKADGGKKIKEKKRERGKFLSHNQFGILGIIIEAL